MAVFEVQRLPFLPTPFARGGACAPQEIKRPSLAAIHAPKAEVSQSSLSSLPSARPEGMYCVSMGAGGQTAQYRRPYERKLIRFSALEIPATTVIVISRTMHVSRSTPAPSSGVPAQ